MYNKGSIFVERHHRGVSVSPTGWIGGLEASYVLHIRAWPLVVWLFKNMSAVSFVHVQSLAHV